MTDETLRYDGDVRTAVQLAAQRATPNIGNRMADRNVRDGSRRAEAVVVRRHDSAREFGRRDLGHQRGLPNVRDEKRRVADSIKHACRQGFVIAVMGNDTAALESDVLTRVPL